MGDKIRIYEWDILKAVKKVLKEAETATVYDQGEVANLDLKKVKPGTNLMVKDKTGKITSLMKNEERELLDEDEPTDEPTYSKKPGMMSEELKDLFQYILKTNLSKIKNTGYSRQVVYDVINFCKKNTFVPTIDDMNLKKIIYNIGAALEQGRYGTTTLTNRGVTNDAVSSFVMEVLKFQNIPNFCKATNLSSTMNMADETNIMFIFDEISSDKEFGKVINSIQSLLDKTSTK
jgi:hypothetical protein